MFTQAIKKSCTQDACIPMTAFEITAKGKGTAPTSGGSAARDQAFTGPVTFIAPQTGQGRRISRWSLVRPLLPGRASALSISIRMPSGWKVARSGVGAWNATPCVTFPIGYRACAAQDKISGHSLRASEPSCTAAGDNKRGFDTLEHVVFGSSCRDKAPRDTS